MAHARRMSVHMSICMSKHMSVRVLQASPDLTNLQALAAVPSALVAAEGPMEGGDERTAEGPMEGGDERTEEERAAAMKARRKAKGATIRTVSARHISQ